jgi:hypothetical protein
VPQNKTFDYLPSNDYDIKTIQTPYQDSERIFAPTESSYKVTGKSESDFKVTYTIPKTDEELAYENRVAELLEQQNKIRNYATHAPLNRQSTLTKQKITRNALTTAAPAQTTTKAPMIRQKNKKDAYRMETAESVSRDDLLYFAR